MQLSSSVAASLESPEGACVLTYDNLNVEQIRCSVASDRAGATVVFVGTTRNSFKGKVVTRLEYQAYSKLAIKTMAEILQNTREVPPSSDHHSASEPTQSLIRAAIHHRLGSVPVGEPSIVIAVSSPHRKAAFAACETILEEVKLRAQIWKREYYEGAEEQEAEWKANNE